MLLSDSLVNPNNLRTRVSGKKGQPMISWYRGIWAEAFRIGWNHKTLWVFGLFAALLSFGSELWGLSDVFSRATQAGAVSIEWGDVVFGSWSRLDDLIQTPMVDLVINPVVAAGAMLLAVMVALLIIAVLSQGALLSAFALSKTEMGLREGWRLGSRVFWKIAFVNIAARLGSLVAFLVVSLPLLAAAQSQSITTMQLLLQTIAFVVLIPCMLICSLANKFILMHMITHSSSLRVSVSESLRLLKKHWLVIFEFVVLLFVINVGMFFALRIGAVIIMIPFLAGIALSYAFAVPVGVTACYVGWMITTLLFVVLATAYMSTVEYAAWVGLYRRVVHEPITAKIERLAKLMFRPRT